MHTILDIRLLSSGIRPVSPDCRLHFSDDDEMVYVHTRK